MAKFPSPPPMPITDSYGTEIGRIEWVAVSTDAGRPGHTLEIRGVFYGREESLTFDAVIPVAPGLHLVKNLPATQCEECPVEKCHVSC